MMTFKRPVIGLELKCLSIEFFLTRTDIYLVNMQKYKMVDTAFILPKGIYQKNISKMLKMNIQVDKSDKHLYFMSMKR